MRKPVFALFALVAVIGAFQTSCDLLDRSVLIDDGEKNTVTDSTKIRVMSSLPDSTQLIIESTTDWHADVAKGGEWCWLSKNDGKKGRDTLQIFVEENTATIIRQTSIVVESGTNIMIFKLTQSAAEGWLDVQYWDRTALQRMGLHGRVESFTMSENWHPTESSVYSFDQRGNLLSNKSIDKAANRYDTTRTFTYDEANHRLSCLVVEDMNQTEVRRWLYDYGNTGKYVAYSAHGWTDPDPLAEDMEGMIVPDLSGAYKIWKEGDFEMHEDRVYTFDGESRLIISIDRWKDSLGVRVPMGCDTMRVSYQYFNSCKMSLPYTSRDNVTNSTYYANGMLKMMKTVNSTYDFLDNPQKMLVISYAYTGDASKPHEIDAYECDYNNNRDLVERRIRYSGQSEVTVELYPQYQYDDKHNWTVRYEENERGSKYTKREFVYY